MLHLLVGCLQLKLFGKKENLSLKCSWGLVGSDEYTLSQWRIDRIITKSMNLLVTRRTWKTIFERNYCIATSINANGFCPFMSVLSLTPGI